jgi:hypothetical protein
MDSTQIEICKELGIPYIKDRTSAIDAINVTSGIYYLGKGPDATAEDMIRRYIGGSGHLKKKGREKTSINAAMISKYHTDVIREYWKLHYTYHGILDEQHLQSTAGR